MIRRAILIALALVALACAVIIYMEPDVAVDPSTVTVIDGDTVRIGSERVRLDAIDAPETVRSHCEAERAAGERATAAMQEIVRNAKRMSIERTGTDRYGRTLAKLYVNGWDVGELLRSAGDALVYEPGRAAHRERIAHWCGPGDW